jgi:SAM-dependent methyltransferase
MIDDYTSTTYGDAWSSIYDDDIIGWHSPDPAGEFLRKRADGGTALELGVGTGRVAIPLARTGIPVLAVDSSAAMLDRTRDKLGDEPVTLVQGDIRTLDLAREFDLVYCVGLSFYQLQSQEDQISCLQVAVRHLRPGGCVVVDLMTPDVRRFRVGQDFLVSKVRSDRVMFSAAVHDPLSQQIKSHVIELSTAGFRLLPNYIRYCWPSEFILLAEKAGLEVVGRWHNFGRAPFTGQPGSYVAELRRAD